MNNQKQKNIPKNKQKKKNNKTESKKVMKRNPPPRNMSAMIAAPAAMARLVTTARPSITFQVDGKCNIRHVEYVADVTGSVAFASTAYAIQPGLVASFPWLANIARRFETYHFRSLRIWYLSESPTTETGFVLYAVDYDAADTAPTSKLQAMSYQESTRGVPWEEFCHISTPKNLSKRSEYYVRADALAANLDIKSYDVGNLFVCTGGNVGLAGRGELYFEYDIDLFTPQLNLSGETLIGGSFTSLAATTPANPFGTSPFADTQNVGVSMNSASTLNISQPGTYLIATFVTGTLMTNVTATPSAGVTVTESGENGTATQIITVYTVASTVANGTITFTASAATITLAVLQIAVAPANSLNLV